MDRFEEERVILDKLSKVLKNVESVSGALSQENRRDGVALNLELQGEALKHLRHLLDMYLNNTALLVVSIHLISTLSMCNSRKGKL